MYKDLLFVPSSSGDTRQKELIYAACKAHTTRHAHWKRKRAKVGTSETTKKKGLNARRSDDSLFRSTSAALHLPADPYVLCGSSNLLSIQDFAVPPDAMHAVSFARFHLTKSWSPSFMLRMTSAKTNGSNYETSQEARIAQWMWHLWTSDNELFWSVVASIIPTMAQFMPPGQRDAAKFTSLQLKARSFRGLRAMLHENTEQSETGLLKTVYYVKSLFREACMSGDVEAASLHARILTRLAMRLVERSPSIEHRSIALWGDALPALLQLRRPMIDLSVQLAPIVEASWAATEPMLPKTRSVDMELSNQVLGNTLRNSFLYLKRAVYIIDTSRITPLLQNPVNVELLFQWLTTKAEHYMCELLNLYPDLITRQEANEDEKNLSDGERHMVKALLLALLHIYQKSFFDIYRSDGIDINESAFVILPALRRALELAKECCSVSEWFFFQDAYFWILFVGTWAESRPRPLNDNVRTTLNQATEQNPSFSLELAKCASDLGLNSWPKAKKVLCDFVWCDFLDPGASKWYTNVTSDQKRAKTV